MDDLVQIRRAILSVSDKAGLVELARTLVDHGVEIISTGGTAKALADAGIPVTHVEAVTGFPEMLDGRVKTLHPAIHGGILARRDDPSHMDALNQHGIGQIDLVCINLYPFEATVAREGVSDAEAIEQIDIGGPSMIRSAAKNHQDVAVVTSPTQYADLIEELRSQGGATSRAFRERLAADAFARTATYDAAIASYLSAGEGHLPRILGVVGERCSDLRYGENPHQAGAVYRTPGWKGPSVVSARQQHGKQLSYNNVADAAAALRLVADCSRLESDARAACVVKHMNPCGCAVASSAAEAINAALDGDRLAAFGGIIAVSSPLDAAGAAILCAEGVFIEVLIAPAVDADALAMLRQRWQNLRVLEVGSLHGAVGGVEFRSIPGGVLAQTSDTQRPDPSRWTLAAGPKPSDGQLRAAAVMECVVRALSSNAVAIGGQDGGAVRLFGAGAGQMDRLAACRIAVEKAGDMARGAVAASDAFFPFADGPRVLIDAGVALIVHPGGSKRDAETFALCEDRGVTCMVTGVRHFRH